MRRIHAGLISMAIGSAVASLAFAAAAPGADATGSPPPALADPAAQRWLDSAAAVAQRVDSARLRESLLADVAAARAAMGDVAGAEAALATLTDAYARADVFVALAGAHAERGEWAEATAAAQKIGPTDNLLRAERARALSRIALERADAAAVTAVDELTAAIGDRYWRDWTLASIAARLASERGGADAAAVAEMIDEPSQRARAWTAIAAAHARDGDAPASRAAAERIEAPNWRAVALAEAGAAPTDTPADRWDAALKLVEAMADDPQFSDYDLVAAFSQIAQVQARVGDAAAADASLARADAAAASFDHPRFAAMALREIVHARAAMGDVESAKALLARMQGRDPLIPAERALAVRAIAAAQVRAGDAARFEAWVETLESPRERVSALIGASETLTAH